MEAKSFGSTIPQNPPPRFRKAENYTRWVTGMELYLNNAHVHSRPGLLLNSLDDSVFDVVAHFWLSSQTDLAVTIEKLKAHFDSIQSVSNARCILRARYQWAREKVDEFLFDLHP